MRTLGSSSGWTYRGASAVRVAGAQVGKVAPDSAPAEECSVLAAQSLDELADVVVALHTARRLILGIEERKLSALLVYKDDSGGAVPVENLESRCYGVLQCSLRVGKGLALAHPRALGVSIGIHVHRLDLTKLDDVLEPLEPHT